MSRRHPKVAIKANIFIVNIIVSFCSENDSATGTVTFAATVYIVTQL